jgi:Ala-tRNA(Pro) deacylase
MNVQQMLSQRHSAYEVLEHPATYSALRMAHALHVPGDEVAKVVILKADGRYVMMVVPATRRVDLQKAQQTLRAVSLELAEEDEFDRLFPDCERGALPPFGSQYGMETWVDRSLAADDQIVFDGNTHRQAIRMPYRAFADVEHPQIADVCGPC